MARLMLRARLGEAPDGNWMRDAYAPLFELAAAEMKRRADAGEMRPIDPLTFVEAAAGVILHLTADLPRNEVPPSQTGASASERLTLAKEHARLFILGALGLETRFGA